MTPLTIQERVDFIRLRRQGHSLNGLVQEHMQQRQEELRTTINEIATSLFNRQGEIEREIEELTEEMQAIDFLQAARTQCQNLEQTMQELNRVNTDLQNKLAEGEHDLADLHRQKMALVASLAHFRQLLHSAKGKKHPSLFEAGEKLCLYISSPPQ